MNEDIHRHLDGDFEADRLKPGDRAHADEWDQMLAAFRTSAPVHGAAPAWLEQKVMAEIDALPEAGPLRRALQWLIRPAPIRVPPLAAALVTAAIAALVVWPGLRGESGQVGPVPLDPNGPVSAASTDPNGVVYVQFMLEAPGATSVAVAGDFSEWVADYSLEDTDGDGVWTGRVPVRPGVHKYMFLIDGSEWATDPRADRYQDDGFGNQNAVLAVAGV